MSSTVTNYVQPITPPLEGLYTSFTQLASQHRSMNDRLHSHRDDLVSNGSSTFQGNGATAFSDLVNYYLDTSEKHMQAFDDAAGAVQTCHSTITSASNSADAAGLHQGLTQHVLGQVTPDDIIQRGSDPIQAVISDMESTWHDLTHNTGGFFGSLIHFHFSSAFDDLIHAGSDLGHLTGDVLGLLVDIGRVLGNWAESVYDAVKRCLPAIESALKTAGNFIMKNWGNIKTILGAIGKISKPVDDFLKMAGPEMKVWTVVFDIIQGKDNSLRSFFSDWIGTFDIGALPKVGDVGLVFGIFSTGLQILGGDQQVLAGLLGASGKDLGISGKDLTADAKNINFGAVIKDLGGAGYDLVTGHFGREGGRF